jgi:hypothetical protein
MLTDTIGVALIVGGAAFVCSGLVFLLPYGRRRPTVEEDIDEVDAALTRSRQSRGELE